MPDQPPLPALTVRALHAMPVVVPPNFILGTTRGAFRQVPLLLIDLRNRGRRHRPLLRVLLSAGGRRQRSSVCSTRSRT